MVAEFNHAVDSQNNFFDFKSMEIQDKPKLLSVGANNVATLISTLNRVGIKSSEIKKVLGKVDNKDFADSQLTKLKNPVKYHSVFSEETLKGYYDALMHSFRKAIEGIESPFELLKGWYRVNTLAYSGKLVSHIVKIDTDQSGELCMYWDYDLSTKIFGAYGKVNVRGPQLFVELNPNRQQLGMEGVVNNSRSRYLILHTGLLDKKNTNKEAFSGMITRLRSNSNAIISYLCLFVKLDAMILEKNPKAGINVKTPLDKVLSELKSLDLDNSLDDYAKTFFDPRHFRDKEHKHCLTVTPLDNYLLTDIPKSDIFLKERSENEKLAGLYMMVCNLPSEKNTAQIVQKTNIGYAFIDTDSTVRIKTDDYYYRGNCVIYPGTNILEIRAEAYLSDNKFDEALSKTDREFSVLLTFSLGDNKSLDFRWLNGVSVAVSQDNAPIALSEKLIRMDRYFMENEAVQAGNSVFKHQLLFFDGLHKNYFKSSKGLTLTQSVLKHYEIENVDLTLTYMKSARRIDTVVDKNSYSYQVYLNAFYGGISNLKRSYERRSYFRFDNATALIDYESQILFNLLSDFQEMYRHGFRYELLDRFEKYLFDDIFEEVLVKDLLLNKYLGSYFLKENIDIIKSSKLEDVSDIFCYFPHNRNACKVSVLEMVLNEAAKPKVMDTDTI